MHTPASVHDGTAAAIHARRVATLYTAFLTYPERFHGRRPYPPPLPTKAWINQPAATRHPPDRHFTTNHASSLMSHRV
jgi:putative transposase